MDLAHKRKDWSAPIGDAENVIVCGSAIEADRICAIFPFEAYQPTAVVIGREPQLRAAGRQGVEVFFVGSTSGAQEFADWLGRPVLCCPVQLDPDDRDSLVSALESAIELHPSLVTVQANDGQQAAAHAVLQRLSEVQFNVDNPPPEEPVIFTMAGVDICHAGNITVIEAQQKAGKSAVLAAGIASTMASGNLDCLGWRSDGNPNAFAVLHIDTEQSRGDHHRLVLRTLARAERAAPPQWLRSYCVTGWGYAEMRQALEIIVPECVARFGGVHSIWLDGTADFVPSPNDELEAFALVRRLQAIAIGQRCPIIGLLHLNPGDSGKSRGHLGSELNRKAETVLRITKTNDGISKVETQWTRHAPILAKDSPRFKWSDEHGRHMSIPTEGNAQINADLNESRQLVAAVWRDRPEAVFKHSQLLAAVVRILRTSESTAKRRITFMQDVNLVEKALGDIGYILTEEGSKCL